jgi:hypothetical protein
MNQSYSLKADSHSAGQEIPRPLRNSNFHYLTHKNPALDPILSYVNPLHTLTNYFKINFNVILPCTHGSLKYFVTLGFPTVIVCAFLISRMHDACPAHLILLDLISLITLVQNKNYETHYEGVSKNSRTES